MPAVPQKWRLNGRPIVVADFGKAYTPSAAEQDVKAPKNHDLESHTPFPTEFSEQELRKPLKLRYNFPEADSNYEGGESDGYCFKLAFRSSNPMRNLEMIRAFLYEHGYHEIPLPASVTELRAFRLPRRQRRQLLLFGDDGYVHNPIKILFPPPGNNEQGLRLEIYNEQAPNHLLRFHGRA